MANVNMPTVMIVEDNPWFAYLMRRYAEKSGCRAVTANHSREVMTLTEKERPAVIMLDALLPEMNSRQVLSLLRDNPATCTIPVILYSALDGRDV